MSSPRQDCAQVVFAGGHCYGMSVASSEDQDALGGARLFRLGRTAAFGTV